MVQSTCRSILLLIIITKINRPQAAGLLGTDPTTDRFAKPPSQRRGNQRRRTANGAAAAADAPQILAATEGAMNVRIMEGEEAAGGYQRVVQQPPCVVVGCASLNYVLMVTGNLTLRRTRRR
jgi:hypothetical protein